MKVVIAGTGYVGLVAGTCFAEIGAHVTCIDKNQEKIHRLQSGIVDMYEPGLEEMIFRNTRRGRLSFATDIKQYVNGADILFLAVGTPGKEDGTADLDGVREVAESVGQVLNEYLLVVTKSTVPVGTSVEIRRIIQNELERRHADIEFDVASNPEFLKEGAAIQDFMSPDRIVIGTDTERAANLLRTLYAPLVSNNNLLEMDIASAEMTKYVSNAILASRISIMNEVAMLCEQVGANVNRVREGVGRDMRIGDKFLHPGCGYGGSCFPKDVKALISTGRRKGVGMKVFQAVEDVNREQKKILFYKLRKIFLKEGLENRKIAIWGLSFKPETDDIREAPSLMLIDLLLKAGAEAQVYDPVGMNAVRAIYGEALNYCEDMYTAVEQTDALLLVTEWREFRQPDWRRIRGLMKSPNIIDGRNLYSKEEMMKRGFSYQGVGC